jgi:hypothetical protein
MGKFQNIEGKKFGRLLALKRHHVTQEGSFWECICDCGNIKVVRLRCLNRGTTRSCGCLQIELTKKKHCKRPFESQYNSFYNKNIKRGMNISLSYEDFLEFTNINKCHYCNRYVHWSSYWTREGGYRYNLDRKNNKLGYSKDNCVVCCRICNLGKGSSFTYLQWFKMTEPYRTGELKTC